jgi:hypothetical protein
LKRAEKVMDEELKRRGFTEGELALSVAQKQAAINSGRASVALEGLKASPEGEAIQKKWVRGELSLEECISEIKALYPYRAGRKMFSG